MHILYQNKLISSRKRFIYTNIKHLNYYVRARFIVFWRLVVITVPQINIHERVLMPIRYPIQQGSLFLCIAWNFVIVLALFIFIYCIYENDSRTFFVVYARRRSKWTTDMDRRICTKNKSLFFYLSIFFSISGCFS